MCARLKLARCIHDLTSLLSNKKLLSAVTRCQSSSERTENDNISRLLKKQNKKKETKEIPPKPKKQTPKCNQKNPTGPQNPNQKSSLFVMKSV